MSQPPQQPWGPQPTWQPPPPKKPKAPLFLGILIGAVTPFFGLFFPLLLGNSSSPSTGQDIAGIAPLVWVFLVLATGAGLLFSDQTRRWGVGILIGLFGMLIIGAGACVAVIVVVLASYSGG